MKHLRVHDYDMAYLDIGAGKPLVCVHGSMGDFRVWNPVLGPLSAKHRVIAPSLRYFFPERWDGTGGGFKIARHVADMIGFIQALDAGPVHLLGHSRGGHIAFRVAEQRPDLVSKLVLAEPGGALDASLAPAEMPPSPLGEPLRAGAAKIAAGDIDGGLALFLDGVDGAGAWTKRSATAKQELRDNAMTLLGQIDEQRPPFSRGAAQSIRMPTLFVGGADSKGAAAVALPILAGAVPGARSALIPHATHMMFSEQPVAFCAIVNDFLDGPARG